MKSFDIHRPLHFDRNPHDVLFVRDVPSHNAYVDHWLPYYDKHNIDFNLPRFTEAYPHTDPIGDLLFWLPNVGICAPGRITQSYALKEPYARYGAHTRMLVAMDLHCIDNHISPSFRSHLNQPKFQCHHNALENGIIKYTHVDHDDHDKIIASLFELNATSFPRVGSLVYFERAGHVRFKWKPVWYIGVSGQELLARSIMADLTKSLVPSLDVRLIGRWG